MGAWAAARVKGRRLLSLSRSGTHSRAGNIPLEGLWLRTHFKPVPESVFVPKEIGSHRVGGGPRASPQVLHARQVARAPASSPGWCLSFSAAVETPGTGSALVHSSPTTCSNRGEQSRSVQEGEGGQGCSPLGTGSSDD